MKKSDKASAFYCEKNEKHSEWERYAWPKVGNGKSRTTHRRNDKAIGRRKAGKHEGGGDGGVANHGIGWWRECAGG